MNALDKLDLSKIVSIIPGMTQDIAKSLVRSVFWELYNNNKSHTLLHIGWINLTISDAKTPLEWLIGPEPTA